ncbi:hypothetical protein B0J15DRAFT_500889 [Fusarium solani]|uniref:SGNH hydrolase-type esterase domain-containing protein n=1 Tax=Fusarium solani TaxID=169388 RepID=A0A9P9K9G6_FUSSL|nr:uncharacterized protein B0J15DRAFT_500889 [Fusarium solani]KAH7244874.1 hypothetical protein B0J15DRAFT_500889 [Fusarium solani]
MVPSALTTRWWDVWNTLTAIILVSSFWVPVANAATRTTNLKPRAPIADGIDLRVLPIGDSITWGAQSSDENGYRKKLFDKLAARGNNVDFVGGMSTGTMADKNHEGHRGYVIDEIRQVSGVGIHAGANIVLLHAGTNDMKNDINPAGAPERLKKLIDEIYEFSPDAVILLCNLIPAGPDRYPATVPRINEFNEAIPVIATEYITIRKKKMLVVGMNHGITLNDLADSLHPNDVGYGKMADLFYSAIESVDERGWISPPGKKTPVPDSTSPENCKSTPSWYNVGMIATGAKVADSDGPFVPAWNKRGVVAEGNCPRARLHFMDLDGDGLKDYACVDPKTGAVKVNINIPDADGKTSGNWKVPRTVVNPTEPRDGWGVMFADLNGDGRDDYIWVDPDTGDVHGWINRLEKDGVWQWQSLGRIAGGVGATNETLQMVDIDGDGRDDFLIVSKKTGEVTAWLNTGGEAMPDYHKIGIIATGASQSDGDTVILGDLTGEGRADYMMVGVGGKVNGLINRRQETSMVPRWSQMFNVAAGPDGAKSNQVRLVDMTGDGKVDYLLVDEKTGEVTLWENLGTGGKWQPGDGVFLCDLDGDGTSDYFWIDHTGKGYGYLNVGKGENKWNDLGMIAKGDHPREQIHMAVLTTSGRADYVVVDPEIGRSDWFENLGPDGGWGWKARGEFAAGPKNTVETKFGFNFKAKNVRFADLDGDGLDDYLYISDTGAVIMWRHLGTNPPSWGIPHLVADGPVGVSAQNVQFADTNGDGKLDYVVVGTTTGMTRTWHHLGFRDDGSIRWNTPLSFADGVGSIGSAIRITEMTGDKRADYVSINPDNGRLNLWHNRCWPNGSGGGGDDGGSGGGDDGSGGGSGDGDGIVYIDPTIWKSSEPTASCRPPCTLVLPPWPLSSKTTISFPVITETIKETWPETTDGVTTYRTTTITVRITLPPITTTQIEVSNIIVSKSTTTIVPVRTSIIPPPVTLTEPTHGITYTYSPGPYPTTTEVGPPPGDNPGDIHVIGGGSGPGPVCKSGCGHICLIGCGSSGGGGGGGGGGCIGLGCPPGSKNCVGVGCGGGGGGDDGNDDDDDDDDDDDCATETNTECHQVCTTSPCKTVCNTFIGCDCTTSKVTDYWVSCKSQSCTTTSTEVITGCFLTATATTTGSYCPLAAVDAERDENGDDNGSRIGTAYKTTFSPTAIIKSTQYRVKSGYVTVDKTAYPVPSATSVIKTKIDGTSATIIPSFVGTTISITVSNIKLSTSDEPKATTTIEPSKTSTDTAYPTHTTFTGDGYCYSGKSGFLKFTQSQAQQVIGSFCSSSYVLEPGNTVGQADALEADGYNVVVSAKWATDQTGCGTKEAFHFADDESNFKSCLRAWNIPFFCTDPDATSSFGGAYVFDPPITGGCLLLRLYAYSTSSLKARAGLEGALAPAVMNITHMGDVKHRVNRPNAPLVWPSSKSEDGPSLFSPEEVKKLAKDTTKET